MALLLQSFYENSILIFLLYLLLFLRSRDLQIWTSKIYLNLATIVTRMLKYLDSVASRCQSFLLIPDEELK